MSAGSSLPRCVPAPPPLALTPAQIEVAERFRAAYESATSDRARAHVIENYVAHHADIAFQPHSWLSPLSTEWRAVSSFPTDPMTIESRRVARVSLAAISRGVTAPITGYVGGFLIGAAGARQIRESKVAEARKQLRHLARDQELLDLYSDWREGRGDAEYERYLRQMGRRAVTVLTGCDLDATPETRMVHPLLAEAARNTHRTRANVFAPLARRFEDDVRRRSLARARSLLVARLNGVRERDLH